MHALKRWTRHAALATLAVAVLAGCENGRFKSNPVLDYGLDLAGLGKEEAAPVVPVAAAPVGAPLIVGYRDIRVALPGTGMRGQSRYFVAPDGVEVAMNNGMVTRVIGLGIDLQGMFLAADSPYLGDMVASARAGATAERIADYYRKGEIVHDTYRCALSYAPGAGDKGIIIEQCRRFFGSSGFQNTYWTENDRIVCSIQWFHPDGDMLQFFETAEQAQSLDLREQGC